MKKLFVLIFVLLLALASCSTDNGDPQGPPPGEETTEEIVVDLSVGDFEAPVGYAEGPDDDNAWNARLLIATSHDGLEWEKTGHVISDQANVPSAIVGLDGTIFVYFVTWEEAHRNEMVVAVSQDNGETWVLKEIALIGAVQGAPPIDPDVLVLDTGEIRMFYTQGDSEGPKVFSALSQDGINFLVEDGERVGRTEDGTFVLDPIVMISQDKWHMYALEIPGEDGSFETGMYMWHATSTDGMTFTTQDPIAEDMFFSNPLRLTDGHRMYGFKNTQEYGVSIYSAYSTDGNTWEVEDLLFSADEENGFERSFVKDPSVVELSDGSYMMFYISSIPR